MPNLTRRARITATAVALITTGMLTGCAGPGPADQRDDVLAIAEVVVSNHERRSGLTDLEVIDDGTTATPCPPNGEHHRYLAYGRATNFSESASIDQRLDHIVTMDAAAFHRNPLLGANLTDVTGFPTDGETPRTGTARAPSGPLAGASLTTDLIPLDDGTILIRIEATTVCR